VEEVLSALQHASVAQGNQVMADSIARPPAAAGPGVLERVVTFIRGVNAEMKKVTWPDIPQVRSATISIIIFVLILGLVITILDFVLQGVLIKMIPSLFAGR
jgi:preprotein translocase subunit SecE